MLALLALVAYWALDVGEQTASLVAKTKKHHHYAWLYAAR